VVLGYDPFGRRTSKTILGTQTGFLYDGANPVQERSGTTVTANSLSGGIDEVFQRTDSAGARSFLTDPLGSTLALTDSTGTAQTSYTFEPFVNTTATGASSTSSFAYTGRELDTTGLYYYRARYYHPQLERFVTEDPLGLRGGMNYYGYVGQNPLSRKDPLGLQSSGSGTDIYPSPLPAWQPPPGNPGFYQANLNVLFLSVSLTRDDFGNWYVSPGLNLGKSIPTIVSGSIARGGFLSVDPVTESKACSVLKQLSFNAAAGFGPGGAVGFTPDFGANYWGANDASNWTGQVGIFSPQIGVGGTWGFYLGNDMSGRGCGCDKQ